MDIIAVITAQRWILGDRGAFKHSGIKLSLSNTFLWDIFLYL